MAIVLSEDKDGNPTPSDGAFVISLSLSEIASILSWEGGNPTPMGCVCVCVCVCVCLCVCLCVFVCVFVCVCVHGYA